jgi:apolipoprotein N-acyltransferase
VSQRDWQEELQNKQRNITPEDTIRNDALVERLLIRGDRKLTPVQRVAAILFSLLWGVAAGLTWWAVLDIAPGVTSNPALFIAVLLIALFGTGFSYLAFLLLRNGISGSSRRSRR